MNIYDIFGKYNPPFKRFKNSRKCFRICESGVSGFLMEDFEICDSRYTQHFSVGIGRDL